MVVIEAFYRVQFTELTGQIFLRAPVGKGENGLEERRSEVNLKTIFIIRKLKQKKGQMQGNV